MDDKKRRHLFERLLQLLLGAKLVRMTALLLTAVFGTGRKASVAPGDAVIRVCFILRKMLVLVVTTVGNICGKLTFCRSFSRN